MSSKIDFDVFVDCFGDFGGVSALLLSLSVASAISDAVGGDADSFVVFFSRFGVHSAVCPVVGGVPSKLKTLDANRAFARELSRTFSARMGKALWLVFPDAGEVGSLVNNNNNNIQNTKSFPASVCFFSGLCVRVYLCVSF